MFSQKTLKILAEAGWNSTRRINISEYEKGLVKEGYTLNQMAKNFLAEFGGLKIVFPHHKVLTKLDEAVFDPILAANRVFKLNVDSYEDRVDESLVVIGEVFRGYMVVVMSNSGKVFAAFDDCLIFLGNNGYEAIENLCLGKDTPEIE